MNTAPEIFSWKDFCNWERFICDFFPKMISEPISSAIRKGKDGFQYEDDVLYFEEFYSKYGNYSELVESLLKQFYERFTFVQMYHCCRPINTQSYYRHGIRALKMIEMNNRFEKLFLGNPKFPKITETHILAAVEQCMDDSNKRHGYVYFGIDDRFLVNNCGHYLIYGSEYRQCLAALIERNIGCDLKSELREYGNPTVFEVRMPVSFFSEDDLRELASKALHMWAYNMAHSRTHSYELDFAKEIDYDFPSGYIIGHYHPKLIPDPSNYT